MISPGLAIDPRNLAALKASVAGGRRSPAAEQAVARQFESIFAQMMIRSMRATHFGDSGLGSAGKLYTSLFDQQVAQAMTQGKGLGLASMLMQQLQGPQTSTSGAADNPAVRALNASDHVSSLLPAATAGQTAQATSASATPPDTATGIPEKIRNFVDRLWPKVEQTAHRLGVSARMIIAQAALETGWGQHEVGGDDATHNLFGIKATGNAPSTTAATTEYIDGTASRVNASFRRYASDADALDGYVDLIGGSPRYRAVVGSGDDAQRFATALQRAGYATDPEYARKLTAIADSPELKAAIEAAARTVRS